MQLHATLLLALAAATLAATAVPANAAPADGAEDNARVTDFRGRPPFARHRAPTADFARFEEAVAAPTSRTVDFRGRPPFSRHAAAPRVSADFARFEETATDTRKARRFGPPGKMTSRR